MEQYYINLCIVLGFTSNPRFRRLPEVKLPKNTVGVFHRKTGISIDDRLDGDELARVLIHELAHYAMDKAGYHSIGQGGPFLATYQMLLNKEGHSYDTMELCVHYNWPSFINIKKRQNHIEYARELIEKYIAVYPDWRCHDLIKTAKWVIQHWPRFPRNICGNFVLGMWHSLISDKRSVLLGCKWTSIIAFVASIVYMLTRPLGHPILDKIALASFILSGILFMWVGIKIEQTRQHAHKK
jgi:hypothetical protein